MGGHFVPEETIRRRFESGLKNFFMLYEPIADSWQMYDNSDVGKPILIASKMNDRLDISNRKHWNNLVELYDETAKK